MDRLDQELVKLEDRALGGVLTGMAQDGLEGGELLRTAGVRICVPDEATGVVWGMPGFVAKAGLADKILPRDQIEPSPESSQKVPPSFS